MATSPAIAAVAALPRPHPRPAVRRVPVAPAAPYIGA